VLFYHGREVLEKTQTHKNGRFLLTGWPPPRRTALQGCAQGRYVLLARHPAYAVAWRNIAPGLSEATHDLRLTRPTLRKIRVTDRAGEPLSGVRIWFCSAGDRDSYRPFFRDLLTVPADVGLIGATTDVKGVAIIANLPETKCGFRATNRGFATGMALSGHDHIRLSVGAHVSCRVLTESGWPASGAVVTFESLSMHSSFVTEADGDGCSGFEDLPARGGDLRPWSNLRGADGIYTVSVAHDDYAAANSEIEMLSGRTIDDLVPAVSSESSLVRCLVLDSATHAPVPGPASLERRSPAPSTDARVPTISSPFACCQTPGRWSSTCHPKVATFSQTSHRETIGSVSRHHREKWMSR
jgi:hypothetical protein